MKGRLHWGPHGGLVRERHLTRRAGWVDYLATPEIIDDICRVVHENTYATYTTPTDRLLHPLRRRRHP